MPNPLILIGVKAVGYSCAGLILNKFYGKRANFLLFAGLRVFSGLAVGFVTLLIMTEVFKTSFSKGNESLILIIWLMAVRIGVWSLLIWPFFERKAFNGTRFSIVVAIGILWSFGLDGILYLVGEQFPEYMNIPMC